MTAVISCISPSVVFSSIRSAYQYYTVCLLVNTSSRSISVRKMASAMINSSAKADGGSSIKSAVKLLKKENIEFGRCFDANYEIKAGCADDLVSIFGDLVNRFEQW